MEVNTTCHLNIDIKVKIPENNHPFPVKHYCRFSSVMCRRFRTGECIGGTSIEYKDGKLVASHL